MAGDFELRRDAAVSALHVYDAPASSLLVRAALTPDQAREVTGDEEARAGEALDTFLDGLVSFPLATILRAASAPVADTVLMAAGEVGADLIVIGTHGRSGVAKLLLGSVASEILHKAEIDVLAVPPPRSG